MQTITVVQHNVNSWFNKNIALYNIYRHLDADIILLNHTGQIDNKPIRIQHYSVYAKNTTNSAWRGTAIAIKNNIQHKLIDNFQTDLIAIEILTRQGPIRIATDYIGPNADYLNYIDYNTLIRTQTPVYILGDLNARHFTLGHRNNNNVGIAIHTLCRENKLTHLGPHFPTFVNTNAATNPDIVLGNNKIFHNLHLTPGPCTPSDHIPIIAKISGNPIQIPIRPRLQYAKANWDNYKYDLTNTPEINLQNATTQQIDKALNTLTKNIQEASNKHIPKIRYRIPPGAKTNATIDTLQQQYNHIYNSIHSIGFTPQLGAQITNIRRHLRTEYQAEHERAWSDIITKLNNNPDPNHFWKSFKRFKGNQKQLTPYLRDHHNNKLILDEDKERLFTQHYIKIYTPYTAEEDIENDFDITNIRNTEIVVNSNQRNIQSYNAADNTRLTATLQPIRLEQLKKLILNTKQKAPGPSGITAHHLKNLPDKTLTDLLHVFNASLSAGYFPKILKQSHTILLPKGSLPQTQVTNYRPITLTETHGKLLDKIVNQSLYSHLAIHNQLNPKQHGFTNNRGTYTALATLHEKIAYCRHNKQHANIVMRDVSKAFDKVWHTGLKYKLLQSELHPCLLKIINSYITDRHTSIKINQHIGPPFSLDCGVPQGGCLSPTLFNLYTSDISEPTTASDHIIYADDITQIIHYPNRNGRTGHLQLYTKRAITSINNFERKWKIKTNTSKFQLLPLFYNPKQPIKIGENTINFTNVAKVLGLTITSNGLQQQVTNNCNKAQAKLSNLHKFRNLSQKLKTLLYKSTILPTIIYPTVPLNTINITQFRKMQKIQNDALRFITNNRLSDRVRVTDLHELIKIDTVNTIIHKQAHEAWTRIKNTQPELYNYIRYNYDITDNTLRFQSSRTLAEDIAPRPIFLAQ